MADPLPPKYQIEALLFASGKAMSEEAIINVTKLDSAVVKRALKALQQEYEKRDSALLIWNDDSGWKMTVREAYVMTVKHVVADTELSRACLETLAVIAYKYPGAMQAEVVDIRGSGAYEHIGELERLGFVVRESSGRSFKLKLTEKFFQYFDVAGGKDIRTAFKDIKIPIKIKPEMQQTLGDVQVVDVAPLPKKQLLDGMTVVDVAEQPPTPPPTKEEEPAAAIQRPEESEEHRAFLDDLDKRIAALSTRNNEHDADPLFQKRMSAETDAQETAEAPVEAPEPVEEAPPQEAPPAKKRKSKKTDG